MNRRVPGWREPSSDFDAVRADFQTLPLSFDVDLSVARPAGSGLVLDVHGNFLFVDQKINSGVARVIFQDDVSVGATRFTLYPGTTARVPFTRLTIENDAQPGMVMRIIYGIDLDLVPGPSNAAPINVVNGAALRTLNEQAFIGSVLVAAVAAQFGHVQLWNPAGSGKRAIVTEIWCATGGARMRIAFNIAALTTLGSTRNKKRAATLGSVCELRSESNAAELGTAFAAFWPPAATSAILQPVEPFILTPGNGILVNSRTVNMDTDVAFSFYEEADS